jgi:hypothetical protein
MKKAIEANELPTAPIAWAPSPPLELPSLGLGAIESQQAASTTLSLWKLEAEIFLCTPLDNPGILEIWSAPLCRLLGMPLDADGTFTVLGWSLQRMSLDVTGKHPHRRSGFWVAATLF